MSREALRLRVTQRLRNERVERRSQRILARLPARARRDLLRVLASPSNVRADLIRQMHERDDARGLAGVLMDLEADPLMRVAVMEQLKDSLPRA